MNKSTSESSSEAPFGTEPRRARWPLQVLIVLFGLAFVLLIWLAVQYPAR